MSRQKLTLLTLLAALFSITTVHAQPTVQVLYAANLEKGDSIVNITNTGANGAALFGPGLGPVGNICVNLYAFSPDEQLVTCCSCVVTPNGLVSLSVTNDLMNNTLTGIRANSATVKLITTSTGAIQGVPTFTGTSCNNTAAFVGSAALPLALGSQAWGTTLHATPVLGGPYALTERPFLLGTLSPGDLASITNRCANIIGNGSGYGICRGCRTGGQESTRF